VTLFAERARLSDSRFTLTGRVAPVVARLVRRLDGMPLAIELAAARVEALGVAGLLDCLDDRFDLLTAGDRLAAGRHRSLAAAVEWSYQLLEEPEQRVFRQISVFPGPFTLEAAEAVAGPDAGSAVLHLVDCSLLVPPRADPDGRFRYVMLETLRAYGSRLLAGAGEREQAGAALAAFALRIAERAAAGLQTGTGEVDAARWLDAEAATTRQALAWAMDHDRSAALRLAATLAPWWHLRGRSPGGYPLLRQAAGYAAPGSDAWCAAQSWLGLMAAHHADLIGALGHFAAVCDAADGRPPIRALVDCLWGRSMALANLGRLAEAGENGRRALALARQLGYPAGEVRALGALSVAARFAGDLDAAVRLARQGGQIQADLAGWIAQPCTASLTAALTWAGDLAAAERSCAVGLARARDTGDLPNQTSMLRHMVTLDIQAGSVEDAASHLRDLLQIAVRAGIRLEVHNGLEACGYLCAATGRRAEALTVWAAYEALALQNELPDPPAEARRRGTALREARQALGEATARAAEDRGAAMSLIAAVEYALLLTAPIPPPAEPPGLARLSARERELVTLVARGCTDAHIAAQLHISIRTVRSHLDRIRDKTGCRRRADLTRMALTAELI
jgi:predicted ATPase/DNA-binding CsgD family transcriptional regulator